MLDFIKEFWPGITATVANGGFPFVTHLREEWVHLDEQSAKISNIVAGLIGAGILCYFNFERHGLHASMAWLPTWFLLVIVGVVLLAAHLYLVWALPDATTKTAARVSAVVLYASAFASLVLAFNLPLVRDGIYLQFGGQVTGCDGLTEVVLIDPVSNSSRAVSPIHDGRYEFLFTEQERINGLAVRVRGHEEGQRNIPMDSSPDLAFNLSCG